MPVMQLNASIACPWLASIETGSNSIQPKRPNIALKTTRYIPSDAHIRPQVPSVHQRASPATIKSSKRRKGKQTRATRNNQ